MGPAGRIIRAPGHPYTRGLLASTVHGAMRGRRLETIAGAPPDLRRLPPGCAFAPRCPQADAQCRAERPGFEEKRPGHRVACWHA